MANNKTELGLLTNSKRLLASGASRMLGFVGDGATRARTQWSKWNSKNRSGFKKRARLLRTKGRRIYREQLQTNSANVAAPPIPQLSVFQLAEAYFEAARKGDTQELSRLLSVDVRFEAGGGSFGPITTRILRGSRLVVPALELISQIPGKSETKLQQLAYINGLPGFVSREDNGHVETTAFEINEGRIDRIFVERDPERSDHLVESLH